MSNFKPTLSENEKAFARSLRLALDAFVQIRPTMPLQYVTTFLLVAEQEGKSVSEYATSADISAAVMTRHLLDIGDRNRAGEEGFGLVTKERERNDLRRQHTRITPRGKAVMHKIISAMKTVPR